VAFVSGHGAYDRSLQAATTSVYRAVLSSDPSASPEPERDYDLAVVADAELALLLGAGAAVHDLSRHLSVGTAIPRGILGLMRCWFREGGDGIDG